MLDDPDVLASLVRTAIARRNIDSLPPLLGDWGSVEHLDVAQLEPAHRGDGGRQANPLWASYATVREAAAIERLARRLSEHADPLTRVVTRVATKAPPKQKK